MLAYENITFAFPCKNRVSMANEAINSILASTNSKIIVIDDCSNSPDQNYIENDRLTIKYNKTKGSLTKLWNECVKLSDTEYVALISDKIRFSPKDYNIIWQKLQEGYGIVATYRLGCFAFSKHLLSIVGLFDEGFTWGEYEDTDVMNRLFAADIGFYLSEETEYVISPPLWSVGKDGHKIKENAKYYFSKWSEESDKIIQLKPEKNFYDISLFKGIFPERKYKKFADSDIRVEAISNFYFNKKYERRF